MISELEKRQAERAAVKRFLLLWLGVRNNVLLCLFRFAVLFGIYAHESLMYIQKEEMDQLILASEGQPPQCVSQLFLEVRYVYMLCKFT